MSPSDPAQARMIRLVLSCGEEAVAIPPFFVHCLGQQQRVLRPGQEAVSAVYCLARRPLGVVASVPGSHTTRPQEPHDDQALHAGWLCDHAQGTPGLALCGDGPWAALYQ